MAFQLCRYIKTNGIQCKSPQLNGRPYCYFHNRIKDAHYIFRQVPGLRDVPLCPTEDNEGVQLALSIVINALASDQIDTKRGTALLYGLQLASMNATRLKDVPSYKQIVRETDPEDTLLAPEGHISTQDEDDEARAQRVREILLEEDDEEDDEE